MMGEPGWGKRSEGADLVFKSRPRLKQVLRLLRYCSFAIQILLFI